MKQLKEIVRHYLRRVFLCFFRFCANRLILPGNRDFGFNKGTPLGRHYIDIFLKRHAHLVRGRCLEFGDKRYKDLFPAAKEYQVLSAFDGPEVSLVGDIHNPPEEWRDSFDAIICTQVFEHLVDPPTAAAAVFSILRKGGLLLLTVPFFNMVHGSPNDYFRYTEEGICGLLERAGFTIENRQSVGNFYVSISALMGYTANSFSEEELNKTDPQFPYTITVVARKL